MNVFSCRPTCVFLISDLINVEVLIKKMSQIKICFPKVKFLSGSISSVRKYPGMCKVKVTLFVTRKVTHVHGLMFNRQENILYYIFFNLLFLVGYWRLLRSLNPGQAEFRQHICRQSHKSMGNSMDQ